MATVRSQGREDSALPSPERKHMPQDVRFDLPFDAPVSRPLECAQERHLRWIRDAPLRSSGSRPRARPRASSR